MPHSKTDIYKALFTGYLINTETPFRINLPRDLVFQLLGDEHHELSNKIIDVSWYFDKPYQTHPYSLFDVDKRKKDYLASDRTWRQVFVPPKTKAMDPKQSFSNAREILAQAALTQAPVVIGESHNHITPKAILMHNIALLKANKAVLFVEGVRKELQDELNKSLSQRSPTPLIDVYLKETTRKSGSRLPQYSQSELIKMCIQEGIPVIGCESELSQLCGDDELITFTDGGQQAGISRIAQHSEYANALDYSRRVFPDRTWHLSLVGNNHAYSYRPLEKESNDIVHPGILEISGGIYIHAEDINPKDESCQISKEHFFSELGSLGTMNDWCREAINSRMFNEKDSTSIANFAQILKAQDTGIELPESGQREFLQRIYAKYTTYNTTYISTSSPKEVRDAPIEKYAASISGGFCIKAHDLSDIVTVADHEGRIAAHISFQTKLANCGAVGKTILSCLDRLNYGANNHYNPYWMNSSQKREAIITAIDALNADLSEETLKTMINSPDSMLYKALNITRLSPLTFFGRLGWNQAQSLQLVQEVATAPITPH
jgi:hypothetical protein